MGGLFALKFSKFTDSKKPNHYHSGSPLANFTFPERNLIVSLTNRKTKVLTALVLSATLISGAVLTNPVSAAGPVIKVTPAKGLTNGQKVTVSGSGFTPNDNVYVIQCLTTAKGQADCATTGLVPVVIDAKGKLAKTTFTVATGAVGAKTCGTSKADASSCDVSVGNATGGDSTTAAITFAVKGKK